MWEETESTRARVYTTYGIQRHVKNQRSICGMHAGDKEVGNLNSSVRRDGRNLNVLVAEGLMQNLQAMGPYI